MIGRGPPDITFGFIFDNFPTAAHPPWHTDRTAAREEINRNASFAERFSYGHALTNWGDRIIGEAIKRYDDRWDHPVTDATNSSVKYRR